MIPVVTVAEMGRIDAEATDGVEVLIDRAGAAVARAAMAMIRGGYGRRVVVVAGKGNNGADGRAAAARLRRRGARVVVIDAAAAPRRLAPCDLVIDAAYGTGFHGDYEAPDPAGAPVLAVDIPSGVNGDTGQAGVGAVRAEATVTFAALKPGLVLGEGAARAGDVTVADIGLDVGSATAHLVTDDDVARWLPALSRDAHKWNRAVSVVAGSTGMLGSAMLSSHGASRAGAGMVRLYSPSTPGSPPPSFPPSEVVSRAVGATGWAAEVLVDQRSQAIVVGPGLGRGPEVAAELAALLEAATAPVVIDADGLVALGSGAAAASVLGRHRGPVVLTPHDGEFEGVTGQRPGDDRLAAVRAAAAALGATVLLKGAATVVADPDGQALIVTAGGPALATAGTGDVLSGIIGAFLAAGVPPLQAAAAAAHVHGRAAASGYRRGLVATDLLELVARWLSRPVRELTQPHAAPGRSQNPRGRSR